MAKIYGLFGSMQGKVADVVMAVRYGEQIVRKYQPIVSNPSTSAQIETRAKLKLASQISAVLGPVIAMRREGAISPRNMFVKQNYGLLSYSSGTADVQLTAIQLTKGVTGLPAVTITRGTGSELTAELSAAAVVDKLVYVVVGRGEDSKLRLLKSVVSETPGAGNTFPTSIEVGVNHYNVVVYAYGIRFNSENAKVIYGNLEAPTAQTIARIIASNSLTVNDVTLTETVGAISAPSN